MFACEFWEISDTTFFKEPFGWLVLKSTTYSQAWAHRAASI